MGDILSELLARRNFARVLGSQALEEAWQTAVGQPLGRHSRAIAVRGGKLEVMVTNSVLVQELTFRKTELLAALSQQLPQEAIRDLRFRVGALS